MAVMPEDLALDFCSSFFGPSLNGLLGALRHYSETSSSRTPQAEAALRDFFLRAAVGRWFRRLPSENSNSSQDVAGIDIQTPRRFNFYFSSLLNGQFKCAARTVRLSGRGLVVSGGTASGGRAELTWDLDNPPRGSDVWSATF
jgi:hypothetical protein